MAPGPRGNYGSYQKVPDADDRDNGFPPQSESNSVKEPPPGTDESTLRLLDHVDDYNSPKSSTSYIYTIGAAYMLSMGVCGIVLVALGSTLSDLAENCGKTSTEIGSVFISRGVGAVLGAVSSAKLYRLFYGNTIISVVLISLSACLLGMPFVSSLVVLHMSFFFLGLCTAITDTGCQIMTRKVHGRDAGPWLGANTVAFGISGALVPLIAFFTGSLFIQYCILATVSVVVGLSLVLLTPPEKLDGLVEAKKPAEARASPVVIRTAGGKSSKRSLTAFYNSHQMEFYISGMVFCLVGGKVGATAYLTQYVEDTDAISYSYSSLLIVVLWIAITVGRLAGLQDQRNLNLQKLYRHTTYLFVGGAFSMISILVFENSAFVLWIAVAGYGLFNGPTVGYCYDLNNRITNPSEEGMSVVMFGLNFGASLVPYIISWLWDFTGWAQTLTVVIFFSMVIPYPLMISAKRAYEGIKLREKERERMVPAVGPVPTSTSGQPSFSV